MKKARIAIVGIHLESNRFAPPTTYADFEAYGLQREQGVLDLLSLGDAYGFAGAMSAAIDWEPVPILIADGHAGGPLVHADYLRLVDEIDARLAAAGPVDAVYIDGHGAGTTTELDDLDGDYFARVRARVGDVPIVATLDLHGNVSEAMVRSTDALVAMRTNPHLDLPERRDEAAGLIARLLTGERFVQTLVRLPLVTPQVTQLTDDGQPLGELMAEAATLIDDDVLDVSLLPGFAFSDTIHNGFAVVATARADAAGAGTAAARHVASRAWALRHRFVRELTDLETAVELARRAGTAQTPAPIILADVADNPGGGGRGNTGYILEALLAAGVDGAVVGPVYDPQLAAEAWDRGVGARFAARFNRAETGAFSDVFDRDVEVLHLSEGPFRWRRGMMRGLSFDPGRCCLLELGGVRVAVISTRMQTLAPDLLEQCGVGLDTVRCFVVKSRGHFRAGFAGLVPDARIYEVDVPGLTTPNLSLVDWRDLPRPVFPLDPSAERQGVRHEFVSGRQHSTILTARPPSLVSL